MNILNKVNRLGIGQLQDTQPYPPILSSNTLGWWDYEDKASLYMPVANRPKYWLDKLRTLGVNIAVNGGFDTDTAWNKNNGWSISGGKARCTATGNALLSQDMGLSTTKIYKITVTVDSIFGSMIVYLGNTGLAANINSIGTYTFIGTTSDTAILYCRFESGETGVIDNVIVEEIAGNHLIQETATDRPTYQATGILFSGVLQFMQSIFTLGQPTTVYLVAKLITWNIFDYLIDGANDISGAVRTNGVTPQLEASAGIVSALNSNLPLDTFVIITVVFNGATSTFQIDDTTALTGNYGALDMGGFTLGSRSTGAANANIEAKGAIIRDLAETKDNQQRVKNYLRWKYGL